MGSFLGSISSCELLMVSIKLLDPTRRGFGGQLSRIWRWWVSVREVSQPLRLRPTPSSSSYSLTRSGRHSQNQHYLLPRGNHVRRKFSFITIPILLCRLLPLMSIHHCAHKLFLNENGAKNISEPFPKGNHRG